MGQVTVTINERAYTVACDDGQEDHILQLGRTLDEKAQGITRKIGTVSDGLLLVMTALLVADELTDTKQELERLRADAEIREKTEIEVVEKLENVSERISTVAQRLEQS